MYGIFKVNLYAHQTYAPMSRADRQRACYLHACLKRVNREYMTNATLRERFAVQAKNSSMISKAAQRNLCEWIDKDFRRFYVG